MNQSAKDPERISATEVYSPPVCRFGGMTAVCTVNHVRLDTGCNRSLWWFKMAVSVQTTPAVQSEPRAGSVEVKILSVSVYCKFYYTIIAVTTAPTIMNPFLPMFCPVVSMYSVYLYEIQVTNNSGDTVSSGGISQELAAAKLLYILYCTFLKTSLHVRPKLRRKANPVPWQSRSLQPIWVPYIRSWSYTVILMIGQVPAVECWMQLI